MLYNELSMNEIKMIHVAEYKWKIDRDIFILLNSTLKTEVKVFFNIIKDMLIDQYQNFWLDIHY